MTRNVRKVSFMFSVYDCNLCVLGDSHMSMSNGRGAWRKAGCYQESLCPSHGWICEARIYSCTSLYQSHCVPAAREINYGICAFTSHCHACRAYMSHIYSAPDFSSCQSSPTGKAISSKLLSPLCRTKPSHLLIKEWLTSQYASTLELLSTLSTTTPSVLVLWDRLKLASF